MDKRSALYFFLSCILLLSSITVFSQETAIYTNQDAGFHTALELFQKQKYGSAQKQFLKIIQVYHNDPNDLIRVDAEYYASLCALELFNKDAELLLKEFIAAHPESPRIQAAYFQLGKYNYHKRKYKEVLEWFTKVDIYNLNNEELSEFYFKRGYSYFEEDSIQQAKKDFFEIKDVDNKYAAPATYYFGHIAYTEKNYQTALQHFDKLKHNESFGPIVPFYIAQIFFLQQKYDSAIAYSTHLLDSTTKRVAELTKIIGESYYRTARFKGALPYLEKYKNIASGLDRTEWYQLGYAYYMNEDYTSAIFCFQSASAGKDSLAQNSYYHLASSYLKPSPYSGGSNSKMLAKNAFAMAYQLDFDKSITEDALFNYAKICYELSFNPFNEAINSLNTYIHKYPNSPRVDECYKYLTGVYLSTKNYAEAMQSITSIKSLDDEMKSAYQKIAFMRGLQLYVNNKFRECISYLKKSLVYPLNRSFTARAYYWEGESYYQLSEKNNTTPLLDSVILSYKTFLSTQGAINTDEFFAAHYNLGYAYFKKADYAESNIWFRKYVGFTSNEPKEKINDAYLRIGDGFFMTRDYYNAVDYYDMALKSGNRDADYAMYQKSLALGLTGKLDAKTKTLTDLLTKYSGKSKYIAAAEHELANTYLQIGDKDKALTYYKKVVSDHPECSFTSHSLLQIGLIQSDKKEYDAAITTIDKVLSNYPKTNDAFEAIRAMKDIYRAKGDMDAYEKKLRSISYISVSTAALDSGNYAVAFDHYDKGDCENAIGYFTKYIQKYTDGIFIINAMFYKAECEYKAANYDQSLIGYEYVLNKPYCQFTETSLLKASFINFKNKNYQNALPQYTRLAEIAEYPANVSEGRIGEMRCQWFLGNHDSASVTAKKVIGLDKISNEIKAEAHLVIANTAMEKQNYDLASNEFSIISSMTHSEKSAEAKYNLAYIQFQKDQFKESQKSVFDLLNQDPSYSYWMGKGYILLADDYVALKDNFNAKYALKAFIEKSTDQDLITIAKDKLGKIEEQEKAEQENKIQKNTDSINIQLPPVNVQDSTLNKQN